MSRQLRRSRIPAGFALFCAVLLAGAGRAEPPMASEASRAQRSFELFARAWMDKLEKLEQGNRKRLVFGAGGGTYRGWDSHDFSTELRPTGNAVAPFVGILRYWEQIFDCGDVAIEPHLQACRVTATTPITEIFRFRNGEWIY